MIKKILMFGVLAFVSIAVLSAFADERTDEEIIAEKLEAKKAEFSAMKEAECQERARTVAMGMVDSIVLAKKMAMTPVSKGGKKTTPKGSTKPSQTPSPGPVSTTPTTPEDKVKSKTSGGNTEQTKEDVKTKTSGGNKEEAKQKVKSKTSGGGGK